MKSLTLAALTLAIATPASAQNFGNGAPNAFGYMPSPYAPQQAPAYSAPPVFGANPAPLPRVTNCTSYRIGNTVETTCF